MSTAKEQAVELIARLRGKADVGIEPELLREAAAYVELMYIQLPGGLTLEQRVERLEHAAEASARSRS